MPLLSEIARRKKGEYFLADIPKDAQVLEIGCGQGWVGSYFRNGGWTNYVGLDLYPPADVVGDIKGWKNLDLKPNSFDVIIAFEVIEHVDLVQECFELLKDGGRLMMTSPVPSMDWAMKTLEIIGLNQKRTSPHCNLIDFRTIQLFEVQRYRLVMGLAQWGVLQKPISMPLGLSPKPLVHQVESN